MNADFHITPDEKELLIECIEGEIRETDPFRWFNPAKRAQAKCKLDNLKSLMHKIREEL